MLNTKLNFYQYKPLKSRKHFKYLKNYLKQKIWFTRLDELNDPFEALFNHKPATIEEILESPQIFERYCHDLKLSPEDLRTTLELPDASRKLGNSRRSDWFRSHGVLCLTSDNSNIPMWAHYADNHQGYCVILELDLEQIRELIRMDKIKFDEFINNIVNPRSDNSDQEILSFTHKLDQDKEFIFTKVLYKKEYPAIEETICQQKLSEDKYNLIKYIVQNSIGVKFEQWSYEQEYRLIVNTNGKKSGLMPSAYIPFLKVTGIIMGEKIDSKNSKKIIKLGQQHNIKIYVAHRSNTAYKIDINEYS